MEIKTNMNVGAVNGVIPAKPSQTPARTSAPDPFASSNALEGALKSVPDSRPDEVERAKKLISDPNYPSADTVKKLSEFLADKLNSSQS